MNPKIAIVGSGALGGHVGAYLARAGTDVTLIDPWPEHVERMRSSGLTLQGQTEPECFTQNVTTLHITELQKIANTRNFDFAFISVKSYDTIWATEMIRAYLTSTGFIVSLQNGMNEERIAAVVGWGKVLGCIASTISVELDGPGHIKRNIKLGGAQHMIFRIGEPHGRFSQRVCMVAELLSLVDSASVTTNLWGERWSKLVVNCMRNPIAAATGRGGNANDSDDYTRKLSLRIAAEAITVGWAHGFELENIYGMSPEDVVRAVDGDSDAMDRVESHLFENMKRRSNQQRPSMGQDIEKSRRTEIDFLNGLVVEKAAEVNIDASANIGIIKAVKRVERGECSPSVKNVHGF